MRIGVINMPGRENYNGQSIRTRFFILGLPLFPTGCIYKISDNLGIDVPLMGKDILHAYAKIHFALLGIGGLFWASNLRGSEAVMKPIILLLSLALLGFSIYSWIAHSSVKGDEELQRRIFGKAFLYNMSPEYLPRNVQKSMFSELLKIYFGKFTKLDWQEDIRKGAVDKTNFSLLYTLAYYQKTIDASPTHQALFTEIAAFLKKGSRVNTSQSANSNTQGKANVYSSSQTVRQPQHATTAESKTAHETATPRAAYSAKASSAKQSAAHTEDAMVSADIFKLQDAKQSLIKQLFLVAGFFLFGFIVTAIITSNKSLLGTVFVICFVLYSIISAIVLLPGYLKIDRDITNRKKIKIKVRIKDMVEELGTAYLVLQPNRYQIKKLTAPAKYYSTGLLNKELEIYVAKESHTLLDIVEVRY